MGTEGVTRAEICWVMSDPPFRDAHTTHRRAPPGARERGSAHLIHARVPSVAAGGGAIARRRRGDDREEEEEHRAHRGGRPTKQWLGLFSSGFVPEAFYANRETSRPLCDRSMAERPPFLLRGPHPAHYAPNLVRNMISLLPELSWSLCQCFRLRTLAAAMPHTS